MSERIGYMKTTMTATLFLILLFSSCAPVEKRPTEQLAFNTVTQTVALYHHQKEFKKAELYIRERLGEKWARHETNTLYFLLAESLFYQKKYDAALRVLEHIDNPAQFPRRLPLLQAKIRYRAHHYQQCLEGALEAYLKAPQSDKPVLSTYILMSYLYLGQIAEAHLWYTNINDAKKAAAAGELVVFQQKHPDVYQRFKEYKGAIPADAEQKMVQSEPEKPEPSPQNFPTYSPNWNSLCVMVSDDAKWSKFNEVIASFFLWYFKTVDKKPVTETVLSFSTRDDVIANFQKAQEKRCFAVVGPLFTVDFSDVFREMSIKTGIPVLTYNRFVMRKNGDNSRFFNTRYNGDEAASLVARFLLEERRKELKKKHDAQAEKQPRNGEQTSEEAAEFDAETPEQQALRIAIVYIDDFSGRYERDIYMKAVRENGAEVTNLLAISPGDTGFLDDLSRIVSLPPNYRAALRHFKKENESKYPTKTLMSRAIDRFNKLVPGCVNFDAVILLLDPKQVAMIVPAFPYKNIEFNYRSSWERFRVRKLNAEIAALYPSWHVSTVTAVFPTEVYYSSDFQQQIGKFLDGAFVAVAASRSQIDRSYRTHLIDAMKQSKEREPFAIEYRLADIAALLSVMRTDRKDGDDVSVAVSTLRGAVIPSFIGGSIAFGDANVPQGRGVIVVGHKGKGFLTDEEFVALKKAESEKKKADEKAKQQKNNSK